MDMNMIYALACNLIGIDQDVASFGIKTTNDFLGDFLNLTHEFLMFLVGHFEEIIIMFL